MSRRRVRCSSSPTSSSSCRLAWKKSCRVRQSPSTSACRMNSSRLVSGSIRPYCTAPVGDERHAVEGDPLARHDAAALGRPVRLGVGALHQVRRRGLDPLGLDPRDGARPHPRGLDQLAGDDAVRRLARQRRPGEHGERDAARALVLGERAASPLRLAGGARRGALVLDADVRQQAGQQRLVHAVGVDGVALGPLAAVRESSIFRSLHTRRSWECRSCHSRTRRKCRCSRLHSRRNALEDSSSCCARTYSHRFR